MPKKDSVAGIWTGAVASGLPSFSSYPIFCQKAPPMMIGSTDCTPGYYNNEGKGWDDGSGIIAATGYPEGPVAYFKYLDGWRSSGGFDGVEFKQG